MSTSWKAFEDRVCRELGGRRVLGNRGSGVPDSDDDVPFSVEAKHGYQKFRLPLAWIDQARRNARPGKPWILVQAPKHCRTPLVTLEFAVFVELARTISLPLSAGRGSCTHCEHVCRLDSDQAEAGREGRAAA